MNTDLMPNSSLQEECELTRHLIDLLKQEQTQLVKADIDGLRSVTEQKMRAVEQISRLTNSRYRALSVAGFAPEEEGMKAWLRSSDVSGAEKYWLDLLQLAHTAKSLNTTNGLLISKHMTRNRQALNILQGSQSGNFYGPNGHSTMNIRARGLVVGY